MSIISDALKRAHLEAINRDRPQRWNHRTPGTVDYPEQQPWRVRFPFMLGVANVVLVLLIGGAIYLRGSIATTCTSPQPSESRVLTTEPTHADSVPPAAGTKGRPRPTTVTRTAAIAASTPATSESRAVEAQTSLSVPTPGSAPVAVAPRQRAAPLPIANPRTRDGLVDGRTYVEAVPLPDGDKLTLYGLTKAGGRGAALINGKVAWEGDHVGDFVVERVERSRVQLRYRDIKVFLMLP